MSERTAHLHAIGVRYACDDCDGGEMIGTGMGRSNGWHSSWLNRCDKCGVEKDLDHNYPTIRRVIAPLGAPPMFINDDGTVTEKPK